jgi:hypothetical protein
MVLAMFVGNEEDGHYRPLGALTNPKPSSQSLQQLAGDARWHPLCGRTKASDINGRACSRELFLS